jgi:probable F420-dependent oxidoreductase
MQLGAVIPHHEIGTDPGAIRAFAEGAEALGVTHLLLYDHVVGVDRNRPGGFEGPYDSNVAFHEPLVLFGFLAACTRTVELVTAVLILPQRQAVLVAKQAAEVAILSGDRLRLGVGAGWNTVEYDALGEEFGTRGRRQAEQVELMRRLWREDTFSFDGEFHRFEHAGILPRPTMPIPVLFGGSAPALLERCARLGDGWMPLGSPNERSAERITELRRLRELAGLAWDGFEIRAQAQYAGGDADRWRSHAERWRGLGATHLAIVTHGAGDTDVDGHLARIAEYLAAVADSEGSSG